MIILKVTKNQGFTFSLEDTNIFRKTTGGWGQTDPPVVLGLNYLYRYFSITCLTTSGNNFF